MSTLQGECASQEISASPAPGTAIVLRLDCCGIDLPARVLDVPTRESDAHVRAWITVPVHVCRRDEVGTRFIATWDCKEGLARSTGVVESKHQRPPRWSLHFDGPIERLTIEERYPDDSPGFLDVGNSRLPARIVDRSLNGVACVVPALAQMAPGERVRVTVGSHKRWGTIARVRGFGNQVRVGIRLDEL